VKPFDKNIHGVYINFGLWQPVAGTCNATKFSEDEGEKVHIE